MTKHQACLARIDALERELFPEWFPQIRSLPKPPRRPPPEAGLIPGRDLRESERDYTRRLIVEAPQRYAEWFLRRKWEKDVRTGGLIDGGSFQPTAFAVSAVSFAPGARWPVTDHDDVRYVGPTNYTQVLGPSRKRVILPDGL